MFSSVKQLRIDLITLNVLSLARRPLFFPNCLLFSYISCRKFSFFFALNKILPGGRGLFIERGPGLLLYAIGDLHLSLETNKSMEVFGGAWDGYIDKIRNGFSGLGPNDICVICGDLSWAMDLDSAAKDFHFLDSLPGRKIVLKGNHDYWWSTATKLQSFFDREGINTIHILHNNCYFYNEYAICGTRGWFFDQDTGTDQDRKILNRELHRLETSLQCAGDRKKICFLHYPPRYHVYVCQEIVSLMSKYGVTDCCYGHIHGFAKRFVVEGNVEQIHYRNVAADNVNFKPVPLL